MRQHTLRSWVRILVLPLLVVHAGTATAGPAADCPAVEFGGATPEEVMAGVHGAVKANDIGEVSRFLRPAERSEIVAAMVAGGIMMVTFQRAAFEMAAASAKAVGADAQQPADPPASAEQAANEAKLREIEGRLQEILERFDLGSLREGDFVGRFGETGGVFVQEQLAALEPNCVPPLLHALWDLFGTLNMAEPTGGMKDLFLIAGEPVVEGDRAAVTAGDQRVDMERIDGRWFVTMPVAP